MALLVDLDSDTDPDPEVDPDPKWIRIFENLDPESESESWNGHKSDSGAGSRAGIVTPLVDMRDIW